MWYACGIYIPCVHSLYTQTAHRVHTRVDERARRWMRAPQGRSRHLTQLTWGIAARTCRVCPHTAHTPTENCVKRQSCRVVCAARPCADMQQFVASQHLLQPYACSTPTLDNFDLGKTLWQCRNAHEEEQQRAGVSIAEGSGREAQIARDRLRQCR